MASTESVRWDDTAVDSACAHLAKEGAIVARAALITSAQLERLLEAAPEDSDGPGRRRVASADLRGTTIEGGVDFSGTTFAGEALFERLVVVGDTNFIATTFGSRVSFYEADFRGDSGFGEATFTGDASFDRARFSNVWFSTSVFREDADFAEAQFRGETGFDGAVFQRDADFRHSTFEYASFRGAQFEQARDLGPLVAQSSDFSEAVFEQGMRIEVAGESTRLDGVVFRGGADIVIRRGDVSIQRVDFREPSLLTSQATAPSVHSRYGDQGLNQPVDVETWWRRDQADAPRVLSLRGSNVAALTIASMDLRPCRFVGAHALDRLRLEDVLFAQPPAGWRRRAHAPIRWTRRQAIAEEHHWRDAAGEEGWYEGDTRAPNALEVGDSPPGAETLAGIYRALRKGREDSKDEPGAADFYYGEMEMRRQAGRARSRGRTVSRAEQLVLAAYWFVAGYGLRASRSLAALAVILALLAIPLALWGFRPDRTYGEALLFTAQSSVSLLRAPAARLTTVGSVVEIVLRLAGPLLFGLAVLSLRGRVKR
jgi:uncharacterized protein YjbI with pentapeptide repeats